MATLGTIEPKVYYNQQLGSKEYVYVVDEASVAAADEHIFDPVPPNGTITLTHVVPGAGTVQTAVGKDESFALSGIDFIDQQDTAEAEHYDCTDLEYVLDPTADPKRLVWRWTPSGTTSIAARVVIREGTKR